MCALGKVEERKKHLTEELTSGLLLLLCKNNENIDKKHFDHFVRMRYTPTDFINLFSTKFYSFVRSFVGLAFEF